VILAGSYTATSARGPTFPGQDPDEMNNLAVDRNANGHLLLATNEKLTQLISDKVGADDGDFLPENKAGWAVTHFDT
jgi:hypothetical protein